VRTPYHRPTPLGEEWRHPPEQRLAILPYPVGAPKATDRLAAWLQQEGLEPHHRHVSRAAHDLCMHPESVATRMDALVAAHQAEKRRAARTARGEAMPTETPIPTAPAPRTGGPGSNGREIGRPAGAGKG
jgi:hypothetical protein